MPCESLLTSVQLPLLGKACRGLEAPLVALTTQNEGSRMWGFPCFGAEGFSLEPLTSADVSMPHTAHVKLQPHVLFFFCSFKAHEM